MTKIVTHDSSFHTDDIFAVATVLLMYPDAQVVRSRDPEIQADADFVLDTGMVYDPARNRLDHHMPSGAGERENGIPYASFGLVWKEFGEKIAGGKREAEIIDRSLIQPIDGHDNGVAVSKELFEGVREYTIGDFLNSYLLPSDKSPERLYEVFMQCVGIAQDLLVREIGKAKAQAEGEKVVLGIYDKTLDKRLIELPDGNLPWRYLLATLPEPLYAVYPRPDGQWGLKTVPDISKSYGHERKPLPESWAGKAGENLERISGVSGAIFAHAKRFMAAAKTREAILTLAKLALDS